MNLSDTFKALGEPIRLRLFSLLVESGELCVCNLTDALQLPQSTVSRHLGVLRHAGLVTTRRDGKWMHYQLAEHVTPELITLLKLDAGVQLAEDQKRLQSSRSC